MKSVWVGLLREAAGLDGGLVLSALEGRLPVQLPADSSPQLRSDFLELQLMLQARPQPSWFARFYVWARSLRLRSVRPLCPVWA